ncbi:MAG: flagellar protein FlaG [Bacillota bacterium]|nr:flagellar protein FlaG [Bacillota bacterium]MDW7683021.1 flagellar protein FlaG [Bacillota bacterium]
MRVQGVDPIILNRIQEKVNKQAVQQSRQTEISDRQPRHGGKGQKAPDRDELTAAVEKLNNTAEALGIGLLFVLDEGDTPAVFVVEKETQNIIRELPPDKIHEMLEDMQGFVGMMVDYLL